MVPRQHLPHTYYVSGMYPELWKQNGLSCISKERIHCNFMTHQATYHLKCTASIVRQSHKVRFLWFDSSMRPPSLIRQITSTDLTYILSVGMWPMCVEWVLLLGPCLKSALLLTKSQLLLPLPHHSQRTALRKAGFSMQYLNGFYGNVCSPSGCWHQSSSFLFPLRLSTLPIYHHDE